MSVLDDALVLEQRAKKYYTEEGKRVTDPSAQKILGLLADEENKHIQALEQMKAGTYLQLTAPSSCGSKVLRSCSTDNASITVIPPDGLRLCGKQLSVLPRTASASTQDEGQIRPIRPIPLAGGSIQPAN